MLFGVDKESACRALVISVLSILHPRLTRLNYRFTIKVGLFETIFNQVIFYKVFSSCFGLFEKFL